MQANKQVTIKDALNAGANKLKNKVKTNVLDAEIILGFVLKKPKEFLYTHFEAKITQKQFQEFLKLIQERAFRKPIAYITGKKEFFGLEFSVAAV